MLIQWIYTRKLHPADEYGKNIPKWQFLDLWLLADYHLTPELQNEAAAMYFSFLKSPEPAPCYWLLEWVWNHTSTVRGEALRKLLITEYSLLDISEIMSNLEFIPKELVTLILMNLHGLVDASRAIKAGLVEGPC